MIDDRVSRGGGGSQLLDDSASMILDSADNSMCSQTSEDSAVFSSSSMVVQQQEQHQQQQQQQQPLPANNGSVSNVDADCSNHQHHSHHHHHHHHEHIPRSSNVLQPHRVNGSGHHRHHGSSTNNNTTTAAPSAAAAAAAPVSAMPAAVAKEKHRSVSEDDFDRTGVLGQGAFGTVYDAVHLPSNTRVALKEIPRFRIRGKHAEEAIKSEINVHRQLRHRNVVRLYSYYVTKDAVVLVMERCKGGTLLDMLRKKQHTQEEPVGLPEHVVSRAVRHIGSALSYLHRKNVCHRDIKCENVLLDDHGVAKLIDFGMSKILMQQQQHDMNGIQEQPQPASSSSSRSTFVGTLDYMAPEVVRGDAPASAAAATRSDVWSLGALALELLTGTPPFYDLSEAVTRQRIQHGLPAGLYLVPPPLANQQQQQQQQQQPSRLSQLNTNSFASSPSKARASQQQKPQPRFSPEATALLTKMLTKDPQERPAIEDVLSSPWLTASASNHH